MPFILSTVLALLAFAANSVLCRMALGNNLIDPAGFTIVRLLSASMTLYILFIANYLYQRKKENGDLNNYGQSTGSWLGSICLFVYALTFSSAYVHLDTGTGALILFGAVQLFMIVYSLLMGNKLLKVEYIGLGVAFFGFVYLIYPEINTPSVTGLVLMSVSGLAWAGYTILGKGSLSPLLDTSYNFFRTIPFVLVVIFLTASTAEYSLNGVWLAVVSGAVMSGIGYAIWYSALKNLTATQAGVLQLSVPVIAALSGVLFMQETMSLRLVSSLILVVGGIALVLLGNKLMKKA